MNRTAIIINVFALSCLLIAVLKDRGKTRQALMIAGKSFLRLLPSVLGIIILIGLLMGFVSPEVITRVAGERAGWGGFLLMAGLGAVLHVPALIAFPLAASLLKSGAAVATVAVFITTLTMIGMVTLPLEIRELGRNVALLRNGLSLLGALAIALIMGGLL